MPLVRIDLIKGKSDAYRRGVGDAVYRALLGIGAPVDDRFQIVTEHEPNGLMYARSYLGIERTDDLMVIQITLVEGRSVDQKRALYQTLADDLHETLALRREDLFVNLIEVAKENWSFGNGIAQYAT